MFRNKFKLKPLKPMGVSINDPLWKRVARWLSYVISVTVVAVLMAVFLLEWMAGCCLLSKPCLFLFIAAHRELSITSC